MSTTLLQSGIWIVTIRGHFDMNTWQYDSSDDPQMFGSEETYKKAIAFLDGVGTLEDWGCGSCYPSRFVKKARYVGLDIIDSKFNAVAVDLRHYRSKAQYILLRHVNDMEVLKCAVQSFRKKLCVVSYERDLDKQKFIKAIGSLVNVPYTEELVQTPDGAEVIYCLKRP